MIKRLKVIILFTVMLGVAGCQKNKVIPAYNSGITGVDINELTTENIILPDYQLVSEARQMSSSLSLDELINKSDIIVKGTIEKIYFNNYAYFDCFLTEVYKGDLEEKAMMTINTGQEFWNINSRKKDLGERDPYEMNGSSVDYYGIDIDHREFSDTDYLDYCGIDMFELWQNKDQEYIFFLKDGRKAKGYNGSTPIHFAADAYYFLFEKTTDDHYANKENRYLDLTPIKFNSQDLVNQ
ncbi:hypothetical protein [Beduini massiliensis]|uniref:hypothetical protein n=1 Tax=Beduini massiliensis TaxID=1585974 RepID=UPI00059A8C00|nr:hypothetical protein [Beduini massiliensis]